jgi:hypothetical protein
VHLAAMLLFMMLTLLAASPASADDWADCINIDPNLDEATDPDYGAAFRARKACTDIIEKGSETKNNLSIAYNNRGEVYAWIPSNDLAIADFESAIALNPKLGKAYYNRAKVLERKNEWKLAVADWRASIANMTEKDAFWTKAKVRLAAAESVVNGELAKLAEEKAKLAFIDAAIARQKQITPDAQVLKSALNIGSDGARLVFYEAACEDPHECEVADIGCDSKSNFEANVGGLGQEDMAVWFASTNGMATLAVDALLIEVQVYNIGFSDMNGDWGVTFSGANVPENIWAILGSAKKISFTVGKRVTVLPHNKDMDELVKACVR